MRTMQFRRAVLLGVVLALTENALAQGCASCYSTVAAGGAQTIHALRNGILVLLFPPSFVFIGLMLLVRRWRTSSEVRQHVSNRNYSVDLPVNAR
jgi:hypothetical protein